MAFNEHLEHARRGFICCLASPRFSGVKMRPSCLHSLGTRQSPHGRLSPQQPLRSPAKWQGSWFQCYSSQSVRWMSLRPSWFLCAWICWLSPDHPVYLPSFSFVLLACLLQRWLENAIFSIISSVKTPERIWSVCFHVSSECFLCTLSRLIDYLLLIYLRILL